MNRDGRALSPILRSWEFAAAAALALATGVAVLLAYLLLDPPTGDLVDLGLYLAMAGGVAIAGCWAVVRWLERWSALGLLGQAILVALIGSATSITTILILAQLMFISSDHDLQVLLAVSAFSAIMAVFCTTWLTSSTLARLLAVARSIRELAAGNLDVQAAVAGADEVASLAEDVNMLAGRLSEARAERVALDDERRNLTASISHDLRTPLSTIQAMVDALDDGVVSDAAGMKRYFATIRRDVARLDRMIDDLFELAQMDAGALRLQRDRVALHEIVEDVVSAMRPRAEQAGLSLDLEIARETSVALLDGDRLERAVANLLRNALEHTPPGGRVSVSVAESGGQLSLKVADTGEGIDPAVLPNIWTRFYRAERSRSRPAAGSDGAGLGLAITKGIVEAHGGTVDVASEPELGTTFTVRIPVSR
ncbi:MAG: HAMP domain-containing histidine kinase [Dehalococcoidia bacterium]|nr:HAMP domain-containing histidine kinase [Dehalococcoidia bacterium]